jgi:hypothetical protein
MVTLHKVRIENLSDWLTSLRLNSGTVLHLPPRATSQELPGVEVQSNADVTKLLERGAISVHQVIITTEDKPEVIARSDSDSDVVFEPHRERNKRRQARNNRRTE